MGWKNCLLAAVLLAAGTAPALASGCDTVITAHVKRLHMPFRSKSVQQHNDNSDELTIEAINIGDKRYVKMSGVLEGDWSPSARDPGKEDSDYRRLMRSQRLTCSLEKSENGAGGMEDVWLTQNSDTDAIESRTWILQSTGLPMRVETYTGQNTERPGTNTTTYEYDDVKPPEASPPSP